MMEELGHDSNRDLARSLRDLETSRGLVELPDGSSSRPGRRRRAWGEVAGAITAVLASAGEMRTRDIHAAVESLLGEPVSPSSVKNCLVQRHGTLLLFERAGRGRYRLAENPRSE
jgi:hypothetical protein